MRARLVKQVCTLREISVAAYSVVLSWAQVSTAAAGSKPNPAEYSTYFLFPPLQHSSSPILEPISSAIFCREPPVNLPLVPSTSFLEQHTEPADHLRIIIQRFSLPSVSLASVFGMSENILHRTVQEARHEADERSRLISEIFRQLNRTILRHEHIIHRRWTKKSCQQRINMLSEIWPEIPKSHRPDMELLESKVSQKTSSRPILASSTQIMSSFMCPHINLEDLAENGPRRLLLLLKSRARNPPAAFADFDWESMRLGQGAGFLPAVLLPEQNHAMFMDDRDGLQGREYGELVTFESAEEAEAWVQQGKGYKPCEGILILRAQERTLKFLLGCCLSILHDIPEKEMASDKYPIQPEPPVAADKANEDSSSLRTLQVEAAYKLPTNLDLRQLADIIVARFEAAEHHLLSLREDPAYFFEAVKEEMDHQWETVVAAWHRTALRRGYRESLDEQFWEYYDPTPSETSPEGWRDGRSLTLTVCTMASRLGQCDPGGDITLRDRHGQDRCHDYKTHRLTKASEEHALISFIIQLGSR